jgi:adenosylhomocysteine nucleosidase
LTPATSGKTITVRATGIVVALAAEAAALTTKTLPVEHIVSLENGTAIWLGGMGQVAAQAAAQALADAGAKALMAFGVAGALDADLRSGTLLCPTHVMDDDGREYAADPAWQTQLMDRMIALGLSAPRTGPLLSMPVPLLAANAKSAAHSRYGALAVDMESVAVARVAKTRALPFAALRAIVDERDDTIPFELHECIDAFGRPRLLRLIAALAASPMLITRLPGLRARMRKAVHALHAAAPALDRRK